MTLLLPRAPIAAAGGSAHSPTSKVSSSGASSRRRKSVEERRWSLARKGCTDSCGRGDLLGELLGETNIYGFK